MTTLEKKTWTNRIAPMAAILLLAIPGAAIAGGNQQAGASYQVSAQVPVACWVRPSTPLLVQSGHSGEVVEACNSPGGFTVSAAYRPLKSTEKATMVYGANALELSRTGQQALRRANMAQIRTIQYRFNDVDIEEPLVLSLTIQPL